MITHGERDMRVNIYSISENVFALEAQGMVAGGFTTGTVRAMCQP